MLVTKEDIPANTEFTVNYGYPFASGPLWYKILMKKHLEEKQSNWQSDVHLLGLVDNVNVFHWNISSEFVSLRLGKLERNK